MSRVYEKSISAKFKNYFCSVNDLTGPFTEYSIDHKEPIRSLEKKYKPWETGRAGVPLAWDGKRNSTFVDHTDTHTLVVGPTGSKKSRLVVMPLVRILGSTGESMIISDPKAEIYNRTAGFLSGKGYNIYVLNLRSPMHGQRWNPLIIPYQFYLSGEIDKAYEFANDIAENLIQVNKSGTDPFWDTSAGSFFFGLTILLFKYCKENDLNSKYISIANIIELRNQLISGSYKTNALWEYAKSDAIIRSALIGTVETAEVTRGGILSVFDQKMRMFSIQPNLQDMLGGNDFDLNKIGTSSTAIFLIVPDEKTGYHGLVSLFIKQSYEYMIYNAQLQAKHDGLHTAVLKNRVNYILDEFSSLPTIQDFPAMITAARSRNIRFTLIIQSKHQLLQRYHDETETIQTNCNNWIFLTSRELQFLEEVSALCGKTMGDNPQPIVTVSDLQRLDKDAGEAVLLCGRSKPCITKLADIEVYDKNHYNPLPLSIRESKPPVILENIAAKIKEQRKNMFFSDNSFRENQMNDIRSWFETDKPQEGKEKKQEESPRTDKTRKDSLENAFRSLLEIDKSQEEKDKKQEESSKTDKTNKGSMDKEYKEEE